MSEVNAVEGDQTIFDDSGSSSSLGGSEADIMTDKPGKNDAAGAAEDAEGDQNDDGGSDDSQKGQKGAKKAAGTPPEDEDDPETVLDDKGQKFIPVHRMKAALKKVTEERDAAAAKVAEYEKPEPIQVPDKETDPEGHAFHTRMEASQAVMRDLCTDYQDVINHYATMAESNPLLNEAVAKHPIPAKLAYDIAKKDLEIKEALAVKGSDEWKEFQEFKKGKKTTTEQDTQAKLNEQVKNGLGRTVPNLNRSTNASPNRNVRTRSNSSDADDDLFKGAL